MVLLVSEVAVLPPEKMDSILKTHIFKMIWRLLRYHHKSPIYFVCSQASPGRVSVTGQSELLISLSLAADCRNKLGSQTQTGR